VGCSPKFNETNFLQGTGRLGDETLKEAAEEYRPCAYHKTVEIENPLLSDEGLITINQN